MRKLRKAMCTVTLVAGAGTGTWTDPDTTLGTGAVTVELEYAPDVVWSNRTTAGAAPGVLTITATATGCTIASSQGADVGVIRVFAAVRMSDLGASPVC